MHTAKRNFGDNDVNDVSPPPALRSVPEISASANEFIREFQYILRHSIPLARASELVVSQIHINIDGDLTNY